MAAANRPTPHEPRRAVAVMRHLANERRHVYRSAATLALLAALLSAASGSLSPPATGDASTLDFGYGVTLTLASGSTIQTRVRITPTLSKAAAKKGGWTACSTAQRTRAISIKKQPC